MTALAISESKSLGQRTHKEKRREYSRLWRKNNPEKVRAARAKQAEKCGRTYMPLEDYRKRMTPRKEAIALGLTRYFTGKICRHGHRSERMCSSSTCVVCLKTNWLARQAQKYAERRAGRPKRLIGQRRPKSESQRAWKQNNRQYVRDYQREYQRKYRNFGPSNPKGELQWLRKNLAQLRLLRRMALASLPEALLSPRVISQLRLNTQILSRHLSATP